MKYDVDHEDDDYSAFSSWLQCYNKEGMNNLADKNGRTIWFKGNPGKPKYLTEKFVRIGQSASKVIHDFPKHINKNKSPLFLIQGRAEFFTVLLPLHSRSDRASVAHSVSFRIILFSVSVLGVLNINCKFFN